MSFLKSITPMLITLNEESNLRRTLDRLTWAEDIVMVDSGSTDGTLDIAREYPQVRVVHREFDTFAQQCNHGLQQVHSEWVLSLDADYVLSEVLVEELRSLSPAESTSGYRCRFRYCVLGNPLHASLYPPRTVLYRKARARYQNEGHGHRLRIEGPVSMLHNNIDHDDRKPLSRWFIAQIHYAQAEADYLLATPSTALNRADRMRRWVFAAPVLVFFYALLFKGLILDGLPGWYYVSQRTLAELMLSLQLLHRRLQGTTAAA